MGFKLKERVKASGKGKAAKAKTYKAASGARYILFIGDEGAVLVYMKDNVVLSRQFVPDASARNLEELKDNLGKDSRAPLLMVLDSMDQSYIQQTLPPVSPLSVNKLIKRRLDRDFGANDIKGAIILGRDEGGRKDWNFMMVSVEKSPQITVWLDFVSELNNRFLGIYLLSVEAEKIVQALQAAMAEPEEEGVEPPPAAEWTFFVSHNKVGGFRQVILRGGRIVFTRMAQPVGESTPEVIAGSIEQEMLSTIEYMRRLSFNPQAGLDIYIVASSGIKAAIDRNKFEARHIHMLTPFEVAQHVGIEGATQPTDQFGDVILAACIGGSRKHVLTLSTPQSRKFDTLYSLFMAQRLAAAVIVLGIFGYAISLGTDIYTVFESSSELEARRDSQKSRLEQLRNEIKVANLDIEKTNDIIDLYQQLLAEKISPLPLLAKVQPILKPPIVIKAIDWSLGDIGPGGAPLPPPGIAPPAAPGVPPGSSGNKATAVFTLQFPGVTTAEAFHAVSKKILDDLQEALKGYDIAFTQLPSGFAESDKMEMTFNAPVPVNPNGQAPEVKLTIKGDAAISPVADAAEANAAEAVK